MCGVAGWDYKDWWGPVYPTVRPRGFDPLSYLSRFFDTIEINSSFYGVGSPKASQGWVRRVQENQRFKFTAKLWQRFTHQRETPWSLDDVEQVRASLAPLADGDRLGCVLAQFSWSFKRTSENEEWLGDVLRAFEQFPLSVEVRHSSWNQPAFYSSLTERGVGVVNIDQPVFQNSIKPEARVTAGVGYVRLHGRNYENWFRDQAESHEWGRGGYLFTRRSVFSPLEEVMMRLLPRDEEFFDLFEQVAQKCHEAAGHLKELFSGKAEKWAYSIEAIKRLEHECDNITHEVVNRLDRTFITPIDREDIHLLASDLDDVIDRIDGTARRVQIFKLTEAPAPGVIELTDVIHRITAVITEAVGKLRNDHQAVISHSIKAKQLEEEGDALYQDILARLFETEKDAIQLIKWKEIYDNLEHTIDQAEDVANDLESIALKHA